MKGFENVTPEIATDLIELVNQLKGLEKSAQVKYSVKNRSTGEWMSKAFDYVPLDNILNKIKENQNFALLQPIGIDENGVCGVKCILVHKSGHVFETNTYPFAVKEGAKLRKMQNCRMKAQKLHTASVTHWVHSLAWQLKKTQTETMMKQLTVKKEKQARNRLRFWQKIIQERILTSC